MNVCNRIWRLIPNKIKRYPGGRELDRFRGIDPPMDDGCPEAWVGSDTVSRYQHGDPDELLGCAQCMLPNGASAYLLQVIMENPLDALGERHLQISGLHIGVLVKLLDAQKQLNLQAHPSRAYAKKFFDSDYGKDESWLVLGLRTDTQEPPYILMGFHDANAKDVFWNGYDTGDIASMEQCCHKIPVSVGDVFFVYAGLPHAIGPGCFILEVQEPSDITVVPWKPSSLRMSDVDASTYKAKVLNCFDYTTRSWQENLTRCVVKPATMREGEWGSEELMIGANQTPHFSFTRLTASQPVDFIHTGFPQIAIVLEGKAVLACGDQRLDIMRADELFFPASVDRITLIPEQQTTIILCNPAGVY